MNILLGYIVTYGFIFIVISLASFLKKKLNQSDETSRKLVHILVALTWIPMVYYFSNTWHLIILPLTFVVLNYMSYRQGIFKAMERQDKNSNSLGTVYYPISMVILAALSVIDIRFLIPYGIGLFCMSLGDGLAPLFGQKFKSHIFKIFGHIKSIYGSLTVFICSLLVVLIFNNYFNLNFNGLEITTTALASTALEFVGVKGLDNLFLPIGTALISYLFIVF